MKLKDDWDGKPYHSFGAYLRERFGSKVWKITVDAGLSCPNRDGTIGYGGCAYCLREAHRVGQQSLLPLRGQIAEGIKRLRARRRAERFIVYFQAGTNTHAPVSDLRSIFDTVREFDNVVGIAVGTRPDCLGEPVLDLLESYADDYEVWLELGLQSAHDETLMAINRGHYLVDFFDAYQRARQRKLKLAVHVIFGLLGEGREEILHTARFVSYLQPDGLKIHPLQILRGTQLADCFADGGFRLPTRDEYVALVCDALELLPPDTTIQRLTAEAPAELLIAPDWCRDKKVLLTAVEAEFKRRGSRQGSRRDSVS